MISKLALLLFQLVTVAGDTVFNFTHPSSSSSPSPLKIFEEASITNSGLIRLTNNQKRKEVGYAFYQESFNVSNKNLSFSTTFVFAIVPYYRSASGDGLTFVLSPTVDPRTMDVQDGEYFGLFRKNNATSEGVFAVEFDTFKNDGEDVKDIDSNHVGIDVNDIKSLKSKSASYFDASGASIPIRLRDGERIQAWVDYHGGKKVVTVTILPLKDSKLNANATKPRIPLLKTKLNLWSKIGNELYVGFSAATSRGKSSHYVLGWSFALNGESQELDLSKLPTLPSNDSSQILVFMFFTVGTFVAFGTIIAWVIAVVVRGKTIEDDEVLEDWEVDYGPQRFAYVQLYEATGGFKRDNIVGSGGFGIVYRGVITVTGSTITKEVAVKRIAHDSKQGLKEFISEIVTTSRLRHRNLLELLGYCRRSDELLLVYEFMPNGSLDRYLFDKEKSINWNQRFEIIKGVAAGLLYLHEEWMQVVVHRDIKSANVLLDGDLNSKLSDFGLARLYDHGSNSQTTSIVGTFGYLAPEMTKTGKATTMTDVFAFGSVLLEAVSGRRASATTFDEVGGECLVIMDWAMECWKRGMLFQVVDEKLKGDYVEDEVNKVVQLALLCSHPDPATRLTIRQVTRILEGDVSLPPISPFDLSSACLAVKQLDGFDGFSSLPISEQSLIEMTSNVELEACPIQEFDTQFHST